MKKIPKKYGQVVFIFLMTVFIGLILSFILTAIAYRFTKGFIEVWLFSFIKTWIIVVPVVVIVLPLVRKIVSKIVEQ